MARDRPLTILMVLASSSGDWGGMERHSVDLANGLAARGHRVVFASIAAYQKKLSSRVQPVTLPFEQFRLHPVLLMHIGQLLGSARFDVIHAQGGKAASLVETLAFVANDCARVATVHSSGKRRPKTRVFHRIIAVSKAIATTINRPVTRVVYNGIEAPPASTQAAPEDLPPMGDQPHWLAIGRLVPAKGFDLLIEAFEEVRGSLWIAGRGPERATLEKAIRDRGLEQRVTLLGYRDDVPALLQACDGVVISSRREGFCYVLAEALQANRPVIATDVPVANEILPPEFICPREDAGALRRLLASVDLNDPQHQQVRDETGELFTLERMLDETLSVYRECLR